jgi:hypothetical protein
LAKRDVALEKELAASKKEIERGKQSMTGMLAQNRAAQEKTAVIGSGICGSVIFCAKYRLFYLLALSRLLVHFFAFFFISWGGVDIQMLNNNCVERATGDPDIRVRGNVSRWP